MKVAVFLSSEKMNNLDKNIIHAVIFTITDGTITGVENEFIAMKSSNYLSLWLLGKHIEEIYTHDMDEDTRSLITKIGITIKTLEEIKDNPLLKALII